MQADAMHSDRECTRSVPLCIPKRLSTSVLQQAVPDGVTFSCVRFCCQAWIEQLSVRAAVCRKLSEEGLSSEHILVSEAQ